MHRAELTFEEGEDDVAAEAEEDPVGIGGGEGDAAMQSSDAVEENGDGSGGEADGVALRLSRSTDGLLRPGFECLPQDPSADVPLSEASSAESRSVDLVVLILTSRNKELGPGKRRDAVRRAWAHESNLGTAGDADGTGCAVRFLFVMGGGKRAHVWQSDMLVLPVADGYRQITQKVLVAFEWTVRHVAFKYLLKTDDDSFVCLARLLELLRPLPRLALYLGAVNRNHAVIMKRHRWADKEYVKIFNRTVYPPYMQGAGYVLSHDLVAIVADRGVELARRTAIEDALVGTLLESAARPRSRSVEFRHKTSSPSGRFAADYALAVCEYDTAFVLLHKLNVAQLKACKGAIQRRRSARCPQGPCACRSLGHRPTHQRRLVLYNGTVVGGTKPSRAGSHQRSYST